MESVRPTLSDGYCSGVSAVTRRARPLQRGGGARQLRQDSFPDVATRGSALLGVLSRHAPRQFARPQPGASSSCFAAAIRFALFAHWGARLRSPISPTSTALTDFPRISTKFVGIFLPATVVRIQQDEYGTPSHPFLQVRRG